MEIIILFAAICNFLLGFLVLRDNSKASLNRWYSLFSFITGVWVISNLVIGFWPTSFWIKTVYAFGALVPAGAAMWILTLTEGRLGRRTKIFIWFLAFIFFVSPYLNNLFLKEIKRVYLGGVEGEYGLIFPFYALYIVGILFYISLQLIRRYRKVDRVKKIQLRFIIVGVVLWAFIVSIVSFILPLFGIFDYTSLDSPTSFIFLIFAFFAITKYHLFNVRVITTELFALAICFVFLIKTILSKDLSQIMFNAALFVVVTIFSSLLVRSVTKEVRQREQIGAMAKEVQKAYEVEKKAREGLARLDDAKNQFIMASQHHLRTPLTSMRGYLELLLDGTYGKISPKVREILGRFQISAQRLIKIVNEFLDITQFQLGKEVITLQPDVDIEPILDEAVEELSPEAKARGIWLKFEKPKEIPRIKADPGKLKIALFNIVDNGIKYTKKGGVTISVSKTDAKIQIAVKDTGAGIPKEEQQELFTRLFERGKGAEKLHSTGKGIGLYITYHIIKAHHGRIWAESEGKGKGSTFFVELPIS